MSKRRVFLLLLLLLLVANYSVYPDNGGWFGNRMRELADVDKTVTLSDDDVYVYDFTTDLFIPQGISTIGVLDADYLVGTANDDLSAEIAVGTTPGGELGNTWASPTVDSTHSGSAHHSAVTVTDTTTIDLTLTGQDIQGVVNDLFAKLVGDQMAGALDMAGNAIYSSTAALKIMPDAEQDVVVFGDSDVGDDTLGNDLQVKRMAEEGDTTITIRGHTNKEGHILCDQALTIQGGSQVEIQSSPGNRIYHFGATSFHSEGTALVIGTSQTTHANAAIKAVTSQTADLLQLKDVSDGNLAYFQVDGDFFTTRALNIDSDTYGLVLGDAQDATLKWNNTKTDVELDDDLILTQASGIGLEFNDSTDTSSYKFHYLASALHPFGLWYSDDDGTNYGGSPFLAADDTNIYFPRGVSGVPNFTEGLGINSLYTFPTDAPSDNYILKWDPILARLAWEADATGAGGSAITFDIGDDGGNDSTDLNEIATTGDTNSIITLDAADKMLIDMGQNWPTADTAASVDTAAEIIAIIDNTAADMGTGVWTFAGVTVAADENITLGSSTIQEDSGSGDLVADNDFLVEQATPYIGWRDTDTDTGFIAHLDESVAASPWQGWALWDVTYSGSVYTIADGYPEIFLDTSNNFSVDTKDNTFYVDTANNRIGIGTAAPTSKLFVDGDADEIQTLIQASATQTSNIFVVEKSDGTDVFDIESSGEVDIIHTADENGDRTLEIDVNAAGFGDVKGIDIVYVTGNISTGENEEAILINIDESLAGGGRVAGVEVLTTTIGDADEIDALEVGVGVNPIMQESGTFGDWDRCEIWDGSFTDCKTAANSTATDVNIFVSDDDILYLGMNSANFEEIEVILETASANPGIKPTFEFSIAGPGWTPFSPADGTNGMRNNGIIAWTASDLTSWAAAAVDGDTAFWVRITRTKAGSLTIKEDILQVASPTNYTWDKNGKLIINEIDIRDDGPHISLIPTSGDSFGFHVEPGMSQSWLSNETDSLHYIFFDHDHDVSIYSSSPEVQDKTLHTGLKHIACSVDPGAWYDSSVIIPLMNIGDEAPNGIIIDEWEVACTTAVGAAPDVDMDLDLKYADGQVGLGNATVIDVLDTSSGASSEDTDSNINGGAIVDNGKLLYLSFGADPEGTGVNLLVDIWFHLN